MCKMFLFLQTNTGKSSFKADYFMYGFLIILLVFSCAHSALSGHSPAVFPHKITRLFNLDLAGKLLENVKGKSKSYIFSHAVWWLSENS